METVDCTFAKLAFDVDIFVCRRPSNGPGWQAYVELGDMTYTSFDNETVERAMEMGQRFLARRLRIKAQTRPDFAYPDIVENCQVIDIERRPQLHA